MSREGQTDSADDHRALTSVLIPISYLICPSRHVCNFLPVYSGSDHMLTTGVKCTDLIIPTILHTGCSRAEETAMYDKA